MLHKFTNNIHMNEAILLFKMMSGSHCISKYYSLSAVDPMPSLGKERACAFAFPRAFAFAEAFANAPTQATFGAKQHWSSPSDSSLLSGDTLRAGPISAG